MIRISSTLAWQSRNFNRLTNKWAGGPAAASAWQQQWVAFRTMFVETVETPNPESLKFIPDTPSGVLVDNEKTGNGWYITKKDDAMEILRSPLASELFKVEHVKAVYLGTDFVTVTKFAEGKWREMRPEIFEKIIAWASSGKPALSDEPVVTDTTILEDDDEVVAMIKELIEARIRPAVQEDGGDIKYVGFQHETGIVTVRLAGSCVGCPSSSVTLKQGVENMLMHYIPEVKTVIAEEEEELPGPAEEMMEQEVEPAQKQQKSYEERLKAAGIPFAD